MLTLLTEIPSDTDLTDAHIDAFHECPVRPAVYSSPWRIVQVIRAIGAPVWPGIKTTQLLGAGPPHRRQFWRQAEEIGLRACEAAQMDGVPESRLFFLDFESLLLESRWPGYTTSDHRRQRFAEFAENFASRLGVTICYHRPGLLQYRYSDIRRKAEESLTTLLADIVDRGRAVNIRYDRVADPDGQREETELGDRLLSLVGAKHYWRGMHIRGNGEMMGDNKPVWPKDVSWQDPRLGYTGYAAFPTVVDELNDGDAEHGQTTESKPSGQAGADPGRVDGSGVG